MINVTVPLEPEVHAALVKRATKNLRPKGREAQAILNEVLMATPRRKPATAAK